MVSVSVCPLHFWWMVLSDNRPDVPAAVDNDFVLIETSDGHQQFVSRRLLCSESLYFRAVFLGGFGDATESPVKIPFDANELQHCLVVLTATLRGEKFSIELEYAVEAIIVASYFCMDRLLNFLTTAILNRIDVNCIIDLYRFAEIRHPPLARALWRKIIDHFETVSISDDFLSMTQDELIRAMEDENLNIASKKEMTVLSKFVQAKERDECEKVVALAVRMKNSGDGAVAPVVRNRVPAEVVMVVGGWCANGPTELVETYNPRNNKWIVDPTLNQMRRAYHSLNVFDGKMVICGGMNGREFFDNGSVMDLHTKNIVATPRLSDRRCYLSSVVVPQNDGGKKLLLVGGYNGLERLNTCEYLNVDDWTYTSVSRMSRARSDASAVLVGNQVAVVGGFDGRVVHQDVEMYDIGSGNWHTIARKMRSPRTGVCAVSLSESVLMVAGGFNSTSRLSSAEIYDLREGLWHALPRMAVSRSNFSLELMNGHVYAVGGFDGQATTGSSERFDLIAQRWETMPALSLARSALKMVRVDDREIVRALVHFDEDL